MDRSSCDAIRHGSLYAYMRLRCRCEDAREDYRLYRKRRRQGRATARLVPALGYIRRVQALQAIGWPRWLQAEHAGLPYKTIIHIQANAWVQVATARALDDLYRRLQTVDGPSRRTENHAWRAGYAPPGAWGEQDIDDPASVPQCWSRPGDPDAVAAELVALRRAQWASLGPAEQVEAYRLAARYGVSQRAMQADWHVSSRVLKKLDAA